MLACQKSDLTYSLKRINLPFLKKPYLQTAASANTVEHLKTPGGRRKNRTTGSPQDEDSKELCLHGMRCKSIRITAFQILLHYPTGKKDLPTNQIGFYFLSLFHFAGFDSQHLLRSLCFLSLLLPFPVLSQNL